MQSFDLFTRHGGQIGGADRAVPPPTLARWLHPAVSEAGMSERVRRYIANAHYADDERRSFAARVFSLGDRGAGGRERETAIHPRGRRVRAARAVDSAPALHRSAERAALPRARAGHAPYGRVENWVVGKEARLVLERMRVLYAAEVAMTDQGLGKLLTRLQQLDLERMVILVSNHGVQLGERGWLGKIITQLHPELIQVPLIITDSSERRAGAQTDYFASTHDLARTLLSMLEVPPPRGVAVEQSTGGSLPVYAG